MDKLKGFRDFLIENREIIESRFHMGFVSKDVTHNNDESQLFLININNPNHKGCLIGWCRVFLGSGENKNTLTQVFYDWESILDSSRKREYLSSNIWAMHPETTTLDHALKRIQRVLDGELIGHIKWEYKKECKRLNIEEKWQD